MRTVKIGWEQDNWFFRQLLTSKRIKFAHKRKQAYGLFAKLTVPLVHHERKLNEIKQLLFNQNLIEMIVIS